MTHHRYGRSVRRSPRAIGPAPPGRRPTRAEIPASGAREEPEEEHAQSRMEDRRRVGPAFATESKRHAGVVREPYRPHECRRANKVAEIEIGIFKSGRQAYGFDDIAIVPSRRTRDPEDVDISWEIDAYRFELPLLGVGHGRGDQPGHRHRARAARRPRRAQPRGPVDPLRGPEPLFDEIRELDDDKATARMQQMYAGADQARAGRPPRIRQMKEAGITTAASVTPQRTESLRQGHPGRRARPAGHPGDRGLGRARLEDRPSRST